MIFREDLTEQVKNEFKTLGVEDEEVMLSICNGFDEIAEIGYAIYNNKRFNRDKDD